MRKCLSAILLVAIMLSFTVFAEGDAPTNISVYENLIKVVANGSNIDVPNYLYNGTTYIPLRAVSEALGANVEWDGEMKTAIITGNEGQAESAFSDEAEDYISIMFLFSGMRQLSEYPTEIISYLDNALIWSVAEYNDSAINALLCAQTTLNDSYANVMSYFDDVREYMNDDIIVNVDMMKFYYNYIYYGLATAANNIGSAIYSSQYKTWELFSSYAQSYKDEIDTIKGIIDIANEISGSLEGGIYMSLTYVDNTYESLQSELSSDSEYMGYLEAYINNIDSPMNYKDIKIFIPDKKGDSNTNNSSSYTSTYNYSTYNFPYHLYSNDGKVYLGKCVTDEFDRDGIYYKYYGDYSSSYSNTSIWNKYSDYGGTLLSYEYSAFNDHADKPPKIVDNDGKFIAYLTKNERITDGWSIEELRQFLINNGQ